MKTLAIAIALLALAGCAQLRQTFPDIGDPDWVRVPARDEYPYSPKGVTEQPRKERP